MGEEGSIWESIQMAVIGDRKMLSRRIGITEMFSRAGGSWNVPDNVRFHSNRSSFVAPEALRSNGNWLRCLRRMAPFLANSSKNPPPSRTADTCF